MHSDMNKNPDLLQNTDLELGMIHSHSNCKLRVRMERARGHEALSLGTCRRMYVFEA